MIGDLTSKASLEIDKRDGGPLLGGYLMIAIDADWFSADKTNVKDADNWLEGLARDNPGVRLPSSRRYRARGKTAQEGLSISREMQAELLACLPTRSPESGSKSA
ncbi:MULTISPECIES: hypothetical protein [unclassified Mesorhizobium]|uniref:hypothetical protein n=1 Tax=unclassified Mesorhizobium TaxID=325217 RepID=UPI002414F19F|nr:MULTISPECIES: hypothetical protein [unclassified Mesorhizobium]MDG4889924.1 hypothetical protein [Mesorhizobium sp. WSM4887]MDG4904067.1 hypothetical protein [Mesorhizobium sp. WSM4962]MDG4909094.1 hypothetical protein [Mesorhizobium sp. WSM4898]MDG4921718.1 hypothetical protein [Mesorhizobium sp. WSM4989]